MDSNNTPPPQYLPDLEPGASTINPNEREWTRLASAGKLKDFAAVLRVPKSTTRADRIKSVPTPWARALLFDHALFDARHPAHSEVTSEWRGLLGLLALGVRIGAPLHPKPIKLDATTDGLRGDLAQMLPKDEAELWNPVVLLLLGDEVVGASSPRTLVFPGIRQRSLRGVPFQKDARLVDPVPFYDEAGDLETVAHLRGWLDSAIRGLKTGDDLAAYTGLRSDKILTALEQWQESFPVLASPTYQIAHNSPVVAAFPTIHTATKVFRNLHPLEPTPGDGQTSDLQLVRTDENRASVVVQPGKLGTLQARGQLYSGPVKLPGGQARQALDGKFSNSIENRQLGEKVLDISSLFCDRLIEVQEVQKGHAFALELRGRSILIPFRPEITALLEPDEIMSGLQVTGDLSEEVIVSLRLAVQQGREVVFSRKYRGDKDVLRSDTGDLAVWPNFVTEPPQDWQHYFYVYQQGSATSTMRFEPIVDVLDKHSDSGTRWWGATSTPPLVWRGYLTDHDAEGLLLLHGMNKKLLTQPAWRVAVDFGSTHTRAFRIYKDAQGSEVTSPIAINSRSKQLLGKTRLYDVFFKGEAGATHSAEELLTSILLPTRGQIRQDGNSWLPSDGVLVWNMAQALSLDDDRLRTRLKWHGDASDKSAFRSYIQQLYLMVAAEAADQGARVDSVVAAFPSVFPRLLRKAHEDEWKTLEARYGVKVETPAPESSALMRYLNREEDTPAQVNLLACDIGGSTSDLAVWTRAQFRVGDSVRLAGDLVGRLMVTNEQARAAVERAIKHPPLQLHGGESFGSRTERADHVFNSMLREIASTQKGSIEVLGRLLAGEGEAGQLVLAHAAYLYAVLSFLMGQLARREDIEHDRIQLRFGGRGAGFWSWMGEFSPQGPAEICSSFLCAGLGRDVAVEVAISKRLKEEVGRGLLYRLDAEPEEPFERTTYFGESGFARNDGSGFEWNDVLTAKTLQDLAEPTALSLAEHEQFVTFLKTFERTQAGREVARTLGISPSLVSDNRLRDRVHEQLFGSESAVAHARRSNGYGTDAALLEPLFVTEARTLLTYVTENPDLFAHLAG